MMSLLFVAVLFAVLLLFMLVPAFVELRKPNDAGPRLISPSFSQTIHLPTTKPRLINLEESHTLDSTLTPFLHVIFSALPMAQLDGD